MTLRLRSYIALLLLALPCVVLAQPDRVYKSLDDVRDPDQVYILRLRNKRLKAIPPQVYAMSNLRELDLRGNRIAHLSDSIALLTNLQRLELSRNPLAVLPVTMASMANLRELILWSTLVYALPPEFSKLDETLRLIDLRNCPLSLDDQEVINQLLPTVKKDWYNACNCGD